MARAPYVFPILGGRKVEHLEANIASLEIRLTAEEIQTVRAGGLIAPLTPAAQ